MPTPVNDVLTQIATDWIATSPPDNASAFPYFHASDETVDPNGQLSHRNFWFEIPLRGEPEAETSATSQVRYACQAILVLDSDGYTPSEFRAAIVNEQSLLIRTIELRTTWPAGTGEVITRGVEITPLEDSGAVLVVFNFEVLVGES